MQNKITKRIARVAALATILSLVASVLPTMAASFTSAKDTMTRLKVSTTADHVIVYTLPTGINLDVTGGSDVLIHDFPESSAFTTGGTWAAADFTFSDGTSRTIVDVDAGGGTTTVDTCTAGVNNIGIAVDTTALAFRVIPCATFTASANAATITFTILGTAANGTLTNPSSANSYSLTLSQTDEGVASANTGSIGLSIVTDDQVSVTASVDPSISFNVGATSSACSTSFAGNGGTVALGSIPTSSTVVSSGASGVFHICTRVSTNASSGYKVSVKSATNNGLVSTSTPADAIASATAAVTPGVANYGICFGTGGTVGHTTTTPDGNDPIGVSPYNTVSCTGVTTAENVGLVDTTARDVVSGTIPVSNSFATLRVKAAASVTTPTHTDYTDTLTFVATGTF